jgi:hypothetical protein
MINPMKKVRMMKTRARHLVSVIHEITLYIENFAN